MASRVKVFRYLLCSPNRFGLMANRNCKCLSSSTMVSIPTRVVDVVTKFHALSSLHTIAAVTNSHAFLVFFSAVELAVSLFSFSIWMYCTLSCANVGDVWITLSLMLPASPAGVVCLNVNSRCKKFIKYVGILTKFSRQAKLKYALGDILKSFSLRSADNYFGCLNSSWYHFFE